MTVEIPLTFEPSPALLEAITLYERYFQAATSVPFDEWTCESAYYAWKDAMKAVFPDGVVVPETVTYSPPRPPDVTDEDIAEIGKAFARGYWPVT